MADLETSQVYCDNDDDTVSDLSSSPSIPDGEIDFNFVYALHTFLATVEGQATAQKGDTLVLLDDSNSYWWLVKNIKDESIGYLPAEHIETPPERLARLNKHRNVDNGASQMIDMAVTPKPTTGLGSKFSLRKARKSGAKTVAFSSPKFIEYEVIESEDDDDDDENEDGNVHGSGQSRELEATIARESVLKPDQRLGDREYSREQDRESPEQLRKEESNILGIGSGPARTNESATDIKHIWRGDSASQTSAHEHKDSHSSFQSETGSSVTTVDDTQVKDSKKKKGVFGGLFKKRSKREKHVPDSVTRITSITSQDETPASELRNSESKKPISQLTSESLSSTITTRPAEIGPEVIELPAAVKEMRSSVLMNTDPVTVDMVEEPHHRGPIDEVEMLHVQRNKTPIEAREPEQQAVPRNDAFVWTDRAIEAYLKNEKHLHKHLIIVVAQQARSERLRNKPLDTVHVYDAVESSIDNMLKELDGLLLR